MVRIELAGTEVRTIECDASVAIDVARRHVPDGLSLRTQDDTAELSLLCFAMVGLRASEPVAIGPRFDYGEALWRIGVTWRDAPAWFAPVCDLDSRFIRALGALLVRYPVREAAIDIGERSAYVRAGHDALAIAVATLGEDSDPVPPRPLLVGSGQRLFRIPWRETPAPWRHAAALTIDDRGLGQTTLGGPVRWSPTGVVHRGRIHHCGFAQRV